MQEHRVSSMVAKHRGLGPKREIVQLHLHKTNLLDWQESTKDYFKEHGAVHLLYSVYSKRAPAATSSSKIIVDLTQQLGKKAARKMLRREREKEEEEDLWSSSDDDAPMEQAAKKEAQWVDAGRGQDDSDGECDQGEDGANGNGDQGQGGADGNGDRGQGGANGNAGENARERAIWRRGLNAVEKRVASGMIEYLAHEGANKGKVEDEEAAKLRAKCYKQLRRSLDLFPQYQAGVGSGDCHTLFAKPFMDSTTSATSELENVVELAQLKKPAHKSIASLRMDLQALMDARELCAEEPYPKKLILGGILMAVRNYDPGMREYAVALQQNERMTYTKALREMEKYESNLGRRFNTQQQRQQQPQQRPRAYAMQDAYNYEPNEWKNIGPSIYIYV